MCTSKYIHTYSIHHIRGGYLPPHRMHLGPLRLTTRTPPPLPPYTPPFSHSGSSAQFGFSQKKENILQSFPVIVVDGNKPRQSLPEKQAAFSTTRPHHETGSVTACYAIELAATSSYKWLHDTTKKKKRGTKKYVHQPLYGSVSQVRLQHNEKNAQNFERCDFFRSRGADPLTTTLSR